MISKCPQSCDFLELKAMTFNLCNRMWLAKCPALITETTHLLKELGLICYQYAVSIEVSALYQCDDRVSQWKNDIRDCQSLEDHTLAKQRYIEKVTDYI